MLRSPCPMVVTLHDLAALKRRSEHLRTGMRLRLRHLAVQRAVRVIVPTRGASRDDAVERLGLERERVVGDPRGGRRVDVSALDAARSPACAQRFALPERYLLWVGGLQHPDRASTSPSSPPRRASCRSCSSARPARGRTSCPT